MNSTGCSRFHKNVSICCFSLTVDYVEDPITQWSIGGYSQASGNPVYLANFLYSSLYFGILMVYIMFYTFFLGAFWFESNHLYGFYCLIRV
uniref:Uncharacterized protein n=1 Tax=Lactuca sativa TaxID=4236 RepID=A0A9R1XUA5_LACSA|nr:hypothetical protein LSAT_V11C100037030 [Lactuca sativa]